MAINGKFAMPKIDLQGCFPGSGKHWTFESSKSIQSPTYMWPCWTALLGFNVQPSCFLFISSLPSQVSGSAPFTILSSVHWEPSQVELELDDNHKGARQPQTRTWAAHHEHNRRPPPRMRKNLAQPRPRSVLAARHAAASNVNPVQRWWPRDIPHDIRWA